MTQSGANPSLAIWQFWQGKEGLLAYYRTLFHIFAFLRERSRIGLPGRVKSLLAICCGPQLTEAIEDGNVRLITRSWSSSRGEQGEHLINS